MRRLSAAVLCAVLIAAGGCGSSNDAPAETGADAAFWGKTYVATQITRGDEPVNLVEGTQLRVSFEEGERYDYTTSIFGQSLSFDAGCNLFGSGLSASRTQLLIGVVGGTEKGCPEDLARQDDWVTAFFAADPRWQLDEDRLTLRAKRTVIRLIEQDRAAPG